MASDKMHSLGDALANDEFLRRLEVFAKQNKIAPLPEPVIACAVCEDRGLVAFDVPHGHDLFGRLMPCEYCEKGQEIQVKQWVNNLQNAGLSRRYQDLTFNTWNELPDDMKQGKRLAEVVMKLFATTEGNWVSMAEAYKRAGRRYPGDDVVRNSVILQGDLGCGKTGLAAAVVNHRAWHKQPTLYIRLQDFFNEIIERYNDNYKPASEYDPKTPENVKRLAKEAPVLVLDEINVQKPSEHNKAVFEEIVRYRAGNNLPTIYTCNFTVEQLREQWNERAMDVLLEMAHWVPMGGPKLRNTSQLAEKQEVF